MSFAIPHDHPCLPGHFPGHPLVPGVVLLDQVVGLIESTHGPLRPLRLPQVKFMQPLRPDEPARIELDGAGPRWRFRVLREADGVLLASGELVAGA
ncbi:beta-hydroxyacyl-ACP dehydratase [Agrilutibacter solisilvae]|uniref:Beta-hydroxyacyl-ACP dehydratase n=1 Tax=Agrilutibacter solisilvae TaxID=2763317 RepID=A0A975ATP0_9GAMM|nr:beta-hydroxyacyl-ACP dehydratase [Lysobacter solisilvae]QSX79299.1 beta-hydroxyacyl-ACP dehydratase [Lysobacter solisilvae]